MAETMCHSDPAVLTSSPTATLLVARRNTEIASLRPLVFRVELFPCMQIYLDLGPSCAM